MIAKKDHICNTTCKPIVELYLAKSITLVIIVSNLNEFEALPWSTIGKNLCVSISTKLIDILRKGFPTRPVSTWIHIWSCGANISIHFWRNGGSYKASSPHVEPHWPRKLFKFTFDEKRFYGGSWFKIVAKCNFRWPALSREQLIFT